MSVPEAVQAFFKFIVIESKPQGKMLTKDADHKWKWHSGSDVVVVA